MSAIRPNWNFYDERKEHVPYTNKAEKTLQHRYNELMKPTDPVRPPAIRDSKVYNKWFKSDK